ncbi:MAG: hypothetical protein KDD70_00905 [Bdellovibrionales bacterium]|nr:hypothetical protein [Bdellovibrionales bacterium]
MPQYNGENCPVHGDKLQQGSARIVYGISGAVPDDPKDHPYARMYTTGGCVVSNDSPEFEKVFYCPTCREHRKAKEQQERGTAASEKDNKQDEIASRFDDAVAAKDVRRLVELNRSHLLPEDKKNFLTQLGKDQETIDSWIPEGADENLRQQIRTQLAYLSLSAMELLKLKKDDPRWSEEIYALLAGDSKTPPDVLREVTKFTLQPLPPGQVFNKNIFVQVSLLANKNTPTDSLQALVDGWLEDSTSYADQLRPNGVLIVLLNKNISTELLEKFLLKKIALIDPRQIGIRFYEIASFVGNHKKFISGLLHGADTTPEEKTAVTSILCTLAKDGLTTVEQLETLAKDYGSLSCSRSETLNGAIESNKKNRALGALCDAPTDL